MTQLKVDLSSDPRVSGEGGPILDYGSQAQHQANLRAILAAAGLVFLIDLFVPVNISPVNYLLLAAAAWTAPRRNLWPLTYFLCFLVMLAPWLKPLTVNADWRFVYIGIINRTLLVAGLCIVTALLHDFRRPRRLYISIGSNDDIDATLSLGVLAVALIFITVVAAIDLVLPAYINPGTLYAIPVLLVALAGTRRTVVGIITLLLVLLVIGFLAGSRPTNSSILHRAAVSRSVGGVVLIILGLLFRRIVGTDASRPGTGNS